MLQVAGEVQFERQSIADHANQLASSIKGNLARSLEAIGVVRFYAHTLFIRWNLQAMRRGTP